MTSESDEMGHYPIVHRRDLWPHLIQFLDGAGKDHVLVVDPMGHSGEKWKNAYTYPTKEMNYLFKVTSKTLKS